MAAHYRRSWQGVPCSRHECPTRQQVAARVHWSGLPNAPRSICPPSDWSSGHTAPHAVLQAPPPGRLKAKSWFYGWTTAVFGHKLDNLVQFDHVGRRWRRVACPAKGRSGQPELPSHRLGNCIYPLSPSSTPSVPLPLPLPLPLLYPYKASQDGSSTPSTPKHRILFLKRAFGITVNSLVARSCCCSICLFLDFSLS